MFFEKMHGLGNDFIVFEDLYDSNKDYSIMAKSMCDRHFGIGADGILVVKNSDIADSRMLIYNSDGSQAEMCGNGIRCFAKYVYEKSIVRKNDISVETLDGIKKVQVVNSSDESFLAKVNMGKPDINADAVPVVTAKGRVINEPISVNGQRYMITSLLMGVPHTIIFVDDIDNITIEKTGSAIEKSQYFPRGTNVNFVRVDGTDEFTIRTWERGAGATLACGTGTCASLVACALNGKTGRAATAHLSGGDLLIEWSDDGCVYMTGPAETAYRGEYMLHI